MLNWPFLASIWVSTTSNQFPNCCWMTNFRIWKSSTWVTTSSRRSNPQVLCRQDWKSCELFSDFLSKLNNQLHFSTIYQNVSSLLKKSPNKMVRYGICTEAEKYPSIGTNPITKLGNFQTSEAVWPDLAIFWTLGNFLKPLATINLPKFPNNFCKGVKIYHFGSEIIFRQLLQTFGDVFSGHTAKPWKVEKSRKSWKKSKRNISPRHGYFRASVQILFWRSEISELLKRFFMFSFHTLEILHVTKIKLDISLLTNFSVKPPVLT